MKLIGCYIENFGKLSSYSQSFCDGLNVIIGENAKVSYSIIDSDVTVGASATVGKSRTDAKGITVIGTGIDVPVGTELADAKMIYNAKDLKEA